MIFVVSKLFWLVARPGNLLCLILALGVLLMWTSRWRRGGALVAVASLGFFVVTVLPVSDWVIAPLEQRFVPPVPLPDRIDGIILLGGAVEPETTRAHGQVALNEAAARVTETLALAQRYPTARIVLSGGNGGLGDGSLSEAAATATLLEADGIDARRLVLEERSRTTFDNAVFTRDLIRPQPGEVWVLVTSAAHMPRAMGCFRHVGWGVVPYPADYRTGRSLTSRLWLAANLVDLDDAVHEWVGLVAYRLLGRIDTLFPGPQSGAAPISSNSAR
ncbi:MAG TPA: YdcF family protein [Stellaceae bacterium]|nr:YdcF family protein [Stellaceae bacterium]